MMGRAGSRAGAGGCRAAVAVDARHLEVGDHDVEACVRDLLRAPPPRRWPSSPRNPARTKHLPDELPHADRIVDQSTRRPPARQGRRHRHRGPGHRRRWRPTAGCGRQPASRIEEKAHLTVGGDRGPGRRAPRPRRKRPRLFDDDLFPSGHLVDLEGDRPIDPRCTSTVSTCAPRVGEGRAKARSVGSGPIGSSPRRPVSPCAEARRRWPAGCDAPYRVQRDRESLVPARTVSASERSGDRQLSA